ncbi:alpha/beta hydrolase [Microbacterium sp. BWT-B31]|uniref:alpha/beta fold hydrolase n=1 Tax=Microbacterium sp. BWT-B31 TaxID=3232072 RepID=UPI00352924D7
MSDIQIFEPDGRAIPYAVEGEGPVSLVLIPEHGIERNALGTIAHYLAEEAGFHVVRVGSRAEADEATALVDHVADVTAVLEHLGLEHTWIGGHGFGGTVAREFVVEHHERVNGLLLLGVEDVDIPLAPVLPVLIIQGTDDQTLPPANGERLRATAPERATVRAVDGAGHLFPMTHPVPTAFIIEEYLDWD